MNVNKLERRGAQKKKELKKFLKKKKKKSPKGLLKTNAEVAVETWAEVDCLACANCCKKMTPTFKKAEVKRIATHLGLSYKEYFDKYLEVDQDNGDIVNKSTPCQHLNMKDHKCDVYELRPADCRLFPHFQRKDFNDVSYVIAENIPRCPATLVFVEKLQERLMS
ncbi:MAG: YkgJ family cysteine cluster protein [Bacteroidetes bacterium]|nr:YkgJ family cysteine cluster protein [Bacteroidota bacterium]